MFYMRDEYENSGQKEMSRIDRLKINRYYKDWIHYYEKGRKDITIPVLIHVDIDVDIDIYRSKVP